jgi:hypothetical protein
MGVIVARIGGFVKRSPMTASRIPRLTSGDDDEYDDE